MTTSSDSFAAAMVEMEISDFGAPADEHFRERIARAQGSSGYHRKTAWSPHAEPGPGLLPGLMSA